MQHCDPDALALLALGEQVDVDQTHLATCSSCAEELEALRSVVTVGRRGPADVTPVQPPASVWEGIAAATGVRAAPRTGTSTSTTGTVRVEPLPRATAEEGSSPVVSDLGARRAQRRDRTERSGGQDGRETAGGRGRRWPGWALAAAAVAGMVAGGGVVATVTGGDESGPGATVSATELEPLQDRVEAGQASVLDRDGDRVLRVTAAGLPTDADGFFEVWLLDAQAQRMVPLGVLRGAEGEFVVPADLDLGDFPVVDVSIEPVDGDPTHSGDSVLRGTLGA